MLFVVPVLLIMSRVPDWQPQVNTSKLSSLCPPAAKRQIHHPLQHRNQPLLLRDASVSGPWWGWGEGSAQTEEDKEEGMDGELWVDRWRWLCHLIDTTVSAEPGRQHEGSVGERLCWQLLGSLFFQAHHGAFQHTTWVRVCLLYQIVRKQSPACFHFGTSVLGTR